MSNELLFINKTQLSLLLTWEKPGEKSLVLSHVQSNRRQAENRQRLSQPLWTGYTTVLVISMTDPTCDSDERQPMTPVDRKKGGREDARHLSRAKARPRIPIPSSTSSLPGRHLQHNESDPFHCTVVGIDAGPTPFSTLPSASQPSHVSLPRPSRRRPSADSK